MPRFIRLFFLLILLAYTLTVQASSYDEDQLEIFSKILPRIILMSSQKAKIRDDIEICILHDKSDSDVVLSLINKIEHNYPKGIGSYQINVVDYDYSDFLLCQETQLTYLFNSSAKNIDRSVDFLKKQAILTLSYDPKLLQSGVNISLFLGRKVVPYINMRSFENSGITLENILLRVSKIYTKDDQ